MHAVYFKPTVWRYYHNIPRHKPVSVKMKYHVFGYSVRTLCLSDSWSIVWLYKQWRHTKTRQKTKQNVVGCLENCLYQHILKYCCIDLNILYELVWIIIIRCVCNFLSVYLLDFSSVNTCQDLRYTPATSAETATATIKIKIIRSNKKIWKKTVWTNLFF